MMKYSRYFFILYFFLFICLSIKASNAHEYSHLEEIAANESPASLKARNPDLYQEESSLEMARRMSNDLTNGRIGYGDTGSQGWVTPTPMPELGDFGASKSDKILVNPVGCEDVENQRKANQNESNILAYCVVFMLILPVTIILLVCTQDKTRFVEAENKTL